MQRYSQKPKTTFSRGLITEAGGLTFPEDASVDELNCDILRDGSRRRRLGMDYESSHIAHDLQYSPGVTTQVGTWNNVGSIPDLAFVVLQIGAWLHFYEVSGESLSSKKKSFRLNLSLFNAPFGTGARNGKVAITSIEGFMIVASADIDTIKVEYDLASDNIIAERIKFRIRDFEWQGDRSGYSKRLSVNDPSLVGNDDRRYDTQNAGWRGIGGAPAYGAYIGATGAMPALTLPWYSGKNAAGNFNVDEWHKIYSGSSLIGNGTFVLDLYLQDRRAASGLTHVKNYTEKTRFTTVTTFASRVFYAGMTSQKYTNVIFFSQIIDDLAKLGDCYQANDPTSEDFSDLLATDGGFIKIPEAYNIKRLHVLGPTLLVFAENGVWQIRGVDNIFKATDYAVSQISESGLKYEDSFVNALGRPYWWSSDGIYSVRVSEEQQTLSGVSLSVDTIQSMYDDIERREECRGAYDRTTKRIFWMYPSDEDQTQGKLRDLLIFDERLAAFVPWRMASNCAYIVDAVFMDDDGSTTVPYNVVTNSGDQVVDDNSDPVTVLKTGRSYFSSSLKFVVSDPSSGEISFAEFNDPTFFDFCSNEYESYIVGAYDFMGDLTTKKNVLYCTVYLAVTEESIVAGSDGVSLVYDRPSSCTVSSLWDFSRTPASIGQQAYRLKRIPIPSGIGPFEYPESVVSTRLRIRGRGRELQLRFESEPGFDFHLLGYDMISGANPRP